MANTTHCPCGLGCWLLGPLHYACGGNNLLLCLFALCRITSLPAPLHKAQERIIAENPHATHPLGAQQWVRVQQAKLCRTATFHFCQHFFQSWQGYICNTVHWKKQGKYANKHKKVKYREQATQSMTRLVDFSQFIPRIIPYNKVFVIWQGTCWVIACQPISQSTLRTVHIDSEISSLPMAKPIDIGLILSIFYLCDLTIDSTIKEWDVPLLIITTVL